MNYDKTNEIANLIFKNFIEVTDKENIIKLFSDWHNKEVNKILNDLKNKIDTYHDNSEPFNFIFQDTSSSIEQIPVENNKETFTFPFKGKNIYNINKDFDEDNFSTENRIGITKLVDYTHLLNEERYECTQDNPLFEPGLIIKGTAYSGYYEDGVENKRKINLSSYPEFFRKMNWWEKRPISEMPRHLRIKPHGDIFTVHIHFAGDKKEGFTPIFSKNIYPYAYFTIPTLEETKDWISKNRK